MTRYQKYAVITAIEGDKVTVDVQEGWDGTLSASLDTNTITITSTEKDFQQGILRVKQANDTIGWTISEFVVTFTAETGWTKNTITLIVDKI